MKDAHEASGVVFVWRKKSGCTGGGLHQPFEAAQDSTGHGATGQPRPFPCVMPFLYERPLAANETVQQVGQQFAGMARSYNR